MSGPARNVAVRLVDGRVQIEHDRGDRRNTATLNNAEWRITHFTGCATLARHPAPKEE